jgi:hypothetical protein
MYQLLGSILCLSSKHFPGFVSTFCCGELKSRQLDELETENSANILELLQSTFLVKTRGGANTKVQPQQRNGMRLKGA